MKKVIVFAFALLGGVVVFAQKVTPSNNVITEARTMLNYSQLSVSDGIEVSVTFTGEEKVEIQAPDNVIQYIETFVEKEVLTIRFRKDFKLSGNATIKVSVSMKSLTKITAVNKSKVVLENTLSGSSLNVSLTNASLIGPIAVQKASIVLAKESMANLSGACKEVKLNLSGASALGSAAFSAEVLVANLSGQSSARMTVTQSLDFTGSKESNLYYLGNPKLKSIKASGNSGPSKECN